MDKKEVEMLIRAALTEAVEGYTEWLEKETVVIDSRTKEILEDTEISIREGGEKDITKYVYPRLEKHGIKFITNEN